MKNILNFHLKMEWEYNYVPPQKMIVSLEKIGSCRVQVFLLWLINHIKISLEKELAWVFLDWRLWRKIKENIYSEIFSSFKIKIKCEDNKILIFKFKYNRINIWSLLFLQNCNLIIIF